MNGPPSRQPSERGSSSREGARPLRLASSMVEGSRMAATVTVLIKAESKLEKTIKAIISVTSLPLDKRWSG